MQFFKLVVQKMLSFILYTFGDRSPYRPVGEVLNSLQVFDP